MIGEFLQQITTALDGHEIPYMLTGSLASSMYGVPRATNDIDIVIAPKREQLLAFVQLLQRVGFMVERDQALIALRDANQSIQCDRLRARLEG